MRRVFQYSGLAILLSLSSTTLMPRALHAQELSSTKGGLAGQITDISGAVVPGAKVTITGGEGTRSVVTAAQAILPSGASLQASTPSASRQRASSPIRRRTLRW